MLDWEPEILDGLHPLELTPTRESEIAEKAFAQHLDDRYQELIASGQSQDSAFHTALDELRRGGFASPKPHASRKKL